MSKRSEAEATERANQDEVEATGHVTLMNLVVCAFAFLAVGVLAKGWLEGTYFSNIGWEKSVEELEENPNEVVTRIVDILHVIQDLNASRNDHQREIASLKEQWDASRKDHQRDIANLKEQSEASRKDLQHGIANLKRIVQELSSRFDNSLTSSPSQEILDIIRLIEDDLCKIIQECRKSSVNERKPSTGLKEFAEGVINFVIRAYHGVVGTKIKGEVMIAQGAYERVSSYWNCGKEVEKEEHKCLIRPQQLVDILHLVKKAASSGRRDTTGSCCEDHGS